MEESKKCPTILLDDTPESEDRLSGGTHSRITPLDGPVSPDPGPDSSGLRPAAIRYISCKNA
jgi:hypothetical protein